MLAFDLGTSLGWAVRYGDGRIAFGVAEFPKHPKGPGHRWLKFGKWLTEIKQSAGGEISAVFYERIDFVSFVEAARTAWAFEAVLTRWCAANGIPYDGYANSTVKRSATGNGHAKKPQVIGALNEQGYPVTDHNAADALACLLHGIKKEDLG
ncbi:MAG: crossover junction endodeoxyribonuclease RuvC [bacterium]|nr:crossover junction endodeoxyribonuclease RuvC [bacterium]